MKKKDIIFSAGIILLFSLVMAIMQFAGAVWNADNNNQLTAYFKMDEGSGNYSLNEINASRNLTLCYASITDICSNWSTGKIGKALWFDSTQSEKATTDALFTSLGLSKSFRVIVYRGGNDGNAEWVVKGGTSDGNYKGFGLYFNASGSPWFYGHGIGDFAILNYSQPVGVWWEYVVVLNTSLSTENISIYVNGTAVISEKDMQNQMNTGVSGITLGSYGSSNYFNGSIDEFATWNRSVSPSEVSNMYYAQYTTSFGPTTKLVYPSDVTNSSSSIQFFACNATVDSPLNISNITTYIWNITNEIISTNLTDGLNGSYNVSNNSFNFSIDGVYHWNCYSCDTDHRCKFADNNYSLVLSFNAPLVTLTSPINDKYFSDANNTYFNWSAIDSNGLGTCQLYGNWTGTFDVNYTWINPTNNTMNFTILNITDEGRYKWNIKCNDTVGNSNFAEQNFTFAVDKNYPLISIRSPSGSLTSKSFTVQITANDTIGLNYCYYNITSPTQSTVYTSNTQISDCSAIAASVISDGDNYILNVFANDSVGNINWTNKSFSVSTGGGGSPGGGGGGTDPTTAARWSMATESNNNLYVINFAQGGTRTKELRFENLDTREITVSLKCVDDVANNNGICKYLFFDAETINLPVLKDTKTITKFRINLPDEIKTGNYTSNIYATDTAGNIQAITIKANVSPFNIISNTLSKLSTNIGNTSFPYFILFLIVGSLVWGGLYLVTTNVKGGGAISVISGMIIGFIAVAII